MYKLIPILLASLLLISVLTVQEAEAKSKVHKKIDKFLRENTIGGDKMKDLCDLSINTLSKKNLTLKIKDCVPTVPEPPKNKAPVIAVVSEVKGEVNQTIVVNATVNDLDGNITSISWSQESGPQAAFISANESLFFIPQVNDTFVFSVKATDDDNATAQKKVSVVVGTKPGPVPDPEPVPDNDTKTVIMVGDIYGERGRTVGKTIQSHNPDLVVLLGDLGYGNDLDYLKEVYGPIADKLICVIGNHEQDLMEEALAYCGSDFHVKLLNNVVFFAINTEADLDPQLDLMKALVQDSQFMNGVESIHVTSHYPCKTPPNSHHPASEDPQVGVFCDAFKQVVPSNVTLYFENGHNHVLSESADGQYKQAGGGGRELYECGTNAAFPFCESEYGFLEYKIEPDGDTTHNFYDSEGGLIK